MLIVNEKDLIHFDEKDPTKIIFQEKQCILRESEWNIQGKSS